MVSTTDRQAPLGRSRITPSPVAGLSQGMLTASCPKQVVLQFRMTDRLFYAEPIKRPEDIIPYLAKQERHWKKGYSAYELAYSWVGAKGIPDPVVAVLHQAEEFQGMELIEGFFEKETHLRSRGRPSQTDLLALIGDGEGFAVLGVEGKVNEPSGRSSRSGSSMPRRTSMHVCRFFKGHWGLRVTIPRNCGTSFYTALRRRYTKRSATRSVGR